MSNLFATINIKPNASIRVYNRDNGDVVLDCINQNYDIETVIDFLHTNYGPNIKIYLNSPFYFPYQIPNIDFEKIEESELVIFDRIKFKIGQKLVNVNIRDLFTVFELYEIKKPKSATKINKFCVDALLDKCLTSYTDFDMILFALEIKPKEAYLILPNTEGYVFENVVEKFGNNFIDYFFTEWLVFEQFVLSFEFNPNVVRLREEDFPKGEKLINLVVDYKRSFIVPQSIKSYNSKPNLMGIDLGTTHLCLTVSRNNRIEPIPIDQSADLWTSSAIYFGKRKPIVGKAAISKLKDDPDSVVYCPKINPCIYYGEESFRHIRGSRVQYRDGEPVYFVKQDGVVTKISLDEVVALFIKTMQKAASKYQSELNQEKRINKAVITIPHWWDVDWTSLDYDNLWLGAIIKAGINLEIEILDIIPEVYADCLYYLSKHDVKDKENILIMDCGGGKTTYQAYKIVQEGECKRIVHLEHPDFTDWHYTANAMGGKHFDNKLEEKLLNILSENFHINALETNKSKYHFFQTTERIKYALTQEEKVTMEMSEFDSNIQNLDVVITRNALNDIFEKEINIRYERKLKQWKMKHNFDVIFLAGGTNRIPIFQEIVKKEFPNSKIIMDGEVEIITAIGAAIHGLQILNNEIEPYSTFKRFVSLEKKAKQTNLGTMEFESTESSNALRNCGQLSSTSLANCQKMSIPDLVQENDSQS